MARIYATLIEEGKKTMNDVPLRLRDEVQHILDEDGWTPPNA